MSEDYSKDLPIRCRHFLNATMRYSDCRLASGGGTFGMFIIASKPINDGVKCCLSGIGCYPSTGAGWTQCVRS